jgi:hypothetical protein
MRTLPALLLATACGSTTPQHLNPPFDASYNDIDNFTPQPTPDAGKQMMYMQPPDGGLPPAMFADGGIFATPPTPEKVFCGQMPCDAVAQVCCVDAQNGPMCASAAQGCSGNVVFECDGPDDCGGDAGMCCVVPTPTDGGVHVTSECLADCSMAAFTMCHSASDCSNDRPACCRGPDFPLGHCMPIDAVQPGDVCDVL